VEEERGGGRRAELYSCSACAAGREEGRRRREGKEKREKKRKKERKRESVSAGFAAAIGYARAAAFGWSATSTRNEEKMGQ
jgi:hypothetical protein